MPVQYGKIANNGEEAGGQRQEVQLACLRIGAELYAIDIMRIKEIIRPLKLTPVPKAPAFIEGVINLRGTVIPVADLRKRFDAPIGEDERKFRIVVCALAGRLIGLLVDEVTEVRRFGRADIAPAPQFIKGPQADYFLGVARRDEELIMLLDLEKILSSDERIALQSLHHEEGGASPS
jgi:purine-binding chemotaxis protein CheW